VSRDRLHSRDSKPTSTLSLLSLGWAGTFIQLTRFWKTVVQTQSTEIYWAMIVLLAGLAAFTVFLPMGQLGGGFRPEDMPASKPVMALAIAGGMLVVYGGLGRIGLALSRKLGYPDLWDIRVTNRQRFLIPAEFGACLGLFLVAADAVLSRFHSLGSIPHPPFPMSVVASAVAGIGEELLFHLFFISVGVWLISRVILKGRFEQGIFWPVAIAASLSFAAAHLPAVPYVFHLKSIAELPVALWIEIMLLNALVGIFCAYQFRKAGFVAAVGVHFWTDMVWHVAWGALHR
jgi:hypothetical protein